MRRWETAVAVLLALCAAEPARAGDVEDCSKAEYEAEHSYDQNYVSNKIDQNMVAACERLADSGDPVGQHRLRLLYHFGWGMPIDFAEAAKWFRKSAEQGNVASQARLGHLYREGQGVPKDLCAGIHVAQPGCQSRKC